MPNLFINTMKYSIVLLFVLIAVSLQAQITLEHTYPSGLNEVGLVEVDSGIHKYIIFNSRDSIYIINLDHSIEKVIHFHFDTITNTSNLEHISKRLFDPDDAYEFLISDYNLQRLTVLKEDGTTLFSCFNCHLINQNTINSLQTASTYNAAIINTEAGAKMLVQYYQGYIAVFGLPGKLPGGKAKSSVETPSIISGNSLPTSAYPNPSNGQIRIEYKLPEGVPTGEIIITNIEGIEMKRYKVGSFFTDILIEKSDLPSGSYFYKLVTEKGESEARKLIILR
jgi:hypothetical protein